MKSIRAATAVDTEIILSFINELAVFEKLQHQVKATTKILQQNLFGENSVAEVLIASLDGKPVGFALFFKNFSTFLGQPGMYLEDLYVQEKFRGEGFGKLLLQELFEICRKRHYQRMDWSVLDWNIKAIEFYESLGAEMLPNWRTFRMTKFI